MAIKCCYKCTPPKRTPTCKFDGTCNKYAEAKKKHDEEKAAADKKRAIEGGLAAQTLIGVNRANKARKRMKRK